MNYKKIIHKIKNEQELDVLGFADLKKLGEYIGKLEKDNAEMSQRIYEHNCRAIGAYIRRNT